jgi:para-nitrobenzyl esterase
MNRRDLLKNTGGLTAAFAVRQLLLPRLALAAVPTAPIASTTSGRVRGFMDRGVSAFKGIPYGMDTATRRFLAPLPPAPWAGVREASEYGPRAPQGLGHSSVRHDHPSSYTLPPDLGPMSEDCLYLNVWTPGLRDHRKRPVLVYIHGGAYSGGSGNNTLYEGVNLCRRGDVVVVTLSHRLNLFGYLYLAGLSDEFPDSGNTGMLDLVLALEWVRDNIEEFGGDPGRVLIFGQSGGGAKCATLMAMPEAHGLFHRVVSMSGQQVTASRPESATARTKAVLAALNLPAGRVGDLRTLPMEQLIAATHATSYYGPVRDGRALPRDPFAPDAPPLSATIPMILGNTHDETRFLIGSSDPTTFALTWETLPAKLAIIAPFFGSFSPAEVVRQYRTLYPAYSPSDVFFAATTAFRSWRGQLIEAERRAGQPAAAAHTWVYELDWKSPVEGGKWGAPHTLDIPLMLDNTAVAEGMSGDGPEARQLAALMSNTLLAFAQTGDPNHAGLPQWHPYSLKRRETMSFAAESRLVDDPRGTERLLIEQVPYTQPGT